MRLVGACVMAAAATGVMACASAGQSAARYGPAEPEPAVGTKVSGTVSYRARIALPPSAVVKVQLVDVSRADAPVVVIGEQVIEAKGRQVPFVFEIPYDAAKIEANHTYAVQARIETDGQLQFSTDQRYPAITHGAPAKVDVIVRPVGGAAHDQP